MPRHKPIQDPLRRWSVEDSAETYHLKRWSDGYFSANAEGNVVVNMGDENNVAIDLKALTEDLSRRGIPLPILLRFSDILQSRIRRLNEAFAKAITEYEYKGTYRGVYPIKVNQSRHVVKEIIRFGRPYHYGLEAGSKPELLAVMAMHEDKESLIICNGYKDEAYIETALLASKLGRTVVLVVEKFSELEEIRRVSVRVGVTPTLGLRARLSARGSGRWEQSGGDRSKFGLSPREMMQAVDCLREWNELDQVRLLHFHLGSQISAIRSIKNALREASRFYVELRKLGCEKLDYFDVGGGLGVDYDGSQTNFASSINYSMQEYANDVVFVVQESCDEAGVPHPTLVTEAGRAIAAHHAVLIFNILGVTQVSESDVPETLPENDEPLVRKLYEVMVGVTAKNARESYHDALEYKEDVTNLFNLGHLSLPDRVLCEHIFWETCRRVHQLAKGSARMRKEYETLERLLSDTYFCNFSVFQSLPDSWAVDQQFPIMPIHRLRERPTQKAVLADITCDSDGKIDSFIDPRDPKHVLQLHPMNGKDYVIGCFLVGAYQEILGDMHNLFGNTNAVHISLSPDGSYNIDSVIAGETVGDVLDYVEYTPAGLIRRMRAKIETAVRDGDITLDESRQLIEAYRSGLGGYTYLER